jgi:hypothetical protein
MHFREKSQTCRSGGGEGVNQAIFFKGKRELQTIPTNFSTHETTLSIFPPVFWVIQK